jgi:hemolysin activation/secretion protein
MTIFHKITHSAKLVILLIIPIYAKVLLIILFYSANLYAITLEQGLEESFKLDRKSTNTERLTKIIQPLKKFKPSSKMDIKFKKEEKCIKIHTIDIRGAYLVPNKEINAIVQSFTNKCLGKVNINNIIKLLNKFYFDYGYITTRAYLPKQKSSKGILKLVIVEGRINKLSSSDKNLYLNNLFSNERERYLNIRNLEQGTDQINRLESYQSKVDIQPTDKIGYSNVVIKSSHKKNIYFRAGFDNNGSESTGKMVTSIGMSINNLVGISDQFMIDLKSNLKSDKNRKLNKTTILSYDVPYFNWNFGTRLNETKNIFLINRRPILAQLKNTNSNIEIYAKNNIYRDKNKKILLNLSWHRKDKISQVNGVNIDVSTYARDYFVADINLSGKTQKNNAYSIDFKIKQGLNSKTVFHNNTGKVVSTPKGFPEKRFRIYKLGGSYNTMLSNNKTNLKLEFDSQYSDNILFGGEMFQIGGVSSVRGYSNIVISGAKGVYFRSTFSFIELSKHIPLNPRFYLLYDMGYIFTDKSSNGGMLNGRGIGVKFNIFKQRLSFEYAENHMRKYDHSFNVSLNTSF